MPRLQVDRTSFLQNLTALAQKDFFPGFSQKVRRFLYQPVGILLVAAAISLICGLFLHPQAFILLAGIGAVLLFGLIFPWFSLRGVQVRYHFPQKRCTDGDQVPIEITVSNYFPWPLFGVSVCWVPVRNQEPVTGMSRIPGFRTVRYRCEFTPTMRGKYPQGGLAITTGFPFGIWQFQRLMVAENELIVWPKTVPTGPVPLFANDHQVEGSVARSKAGNSGDVLGVRPYRRGDSPRRIHWPQSARHDRLIVCELQATTRPVIHLILDLDPHSHCGVGADSSMEWAIRITASFVKGWLEEGSQVGLTLGKTVLPDGAGLIHSQRLLDELASVPSLEALKQARVGEAGPVHQCNLDHHHVAGLQILITTDLGLQEISSRWRCHGQDLAILLLRSHAFDPAVPEASITHEPWLTIDSVATIPDRLRSSWKEATYGA
ncbi:MAG: DUF58 domain-containing protein [Zavarzinella sp.]